MVRVSVTPPSCWEPLCRSRGGAWTFRRQLLLLLLLLPLFGEQAAFGGCPARHAQDCRAARPRTTDAWVAAVRDVRGVSARRARERKGRTHGGGEVARFDLSLFFFWSLLRGRGRARGARAYLPVTSRSQPGRDERARAFVASLAVALGGRSATRDKKRPRRSREEGDEATSRKRWGAAASAGARARVLASGGGRGLCRWGRGARVFLFCVLCLCVCEGGAEARGRRRKRRRRRAAEQDAGAATPDAARPCTDNPNPPSSGDATHLQPHTHT